MPNAAPDPVLERRAAAWIRRTRYKATLEARSQHPGKPDFSQCNNAEECAIIQLCGDVEVWRQLSSVEPDEQPAAEAALSAALVSLGAKAPTPQRGESQEREPDVTPQSAENLRKLGLDSRLATCRTESEFLEVQAAEKAKK